MPLAHTANTRIILPDGPFIHNLSLSQQVKGGTSTRARREVREICPVFYFHPLWQKHEPCTKKLSISSADWHFTQLHDNTTSSWSSLLHRRQSMKKQGSYAWLSSFPSHTAAETSTHIQPSLITTKIVCGWPSPRDTEQPFYPTHSSHPRYSSTPHFPSLLSPSSLLPFSLSETSNYLLP